MGLTVTEAPPDLVSDSTKRADDQPRSSRLTKLRVGLIAAMAAVLALAAGGIFDQRMWVLVAAAVLPAGVAVSLNRRNGLVRVLAALLSIVGALTIAVVVSGGSFGDAIDAVTNGPQRMLSTEWPSPDRVEFVGATAAALATMTAIAAELAMRPRWHLLPLVPVVAAYGAIVALSAPTGVRLGWTLLIGLLAIGFATLRNDVGGDDQLALLRGERRLIPVAVIATGLAALLSVPIDLGLRADPRQNEPPEQTAPLLDPIEATLALRAIDPPIPLHLIEGSSDDLLPARWRTAALDVYDGQRWAPDLVLRPIGRRLGTAEDGAIEVTVRFLDDDLSLIPLPGSPVTVDAPIETDEQRTLVRLLERPGPADEIPVTANLAPLAAGTVTAQVATRPVTESVSGLTEFAESLAGDGAVIDRLRTIEQTMRNEFVLETSAPGGGVQRALIERFLRDTRRGNAEQFVTSYVLLARSLGVDARVATGYEIDAADRGAEIQLRSSHARIWPEVRLVDGGWLSFDPVPPDEVTDLAEPEVEPQFQTPAAPQPPIDPPPEPSNDTPLTDESAGDSTAGALSNAVVWLVRGAAAVGILLVPLLIVIGMIVGLKRRRRHQRLSAPAPGERIRGTWAVATDSLVDAGLSIDPAATDAEIAGAGAPLAPAAVTELNRLATLSSAVTFGAPSRPDLLVDDAAACLDQVERSVGETMSRWQRARWRLSPRSLRRATRSPIDT
jgi:hypothetical protein